MIGEPKAVSGRLNLGLGFPLSDSDAYTLPQSSYHFSTW